MSGSETVIVRETGMGKYQVAAQMGDTTLLLDEPKSVGGLGSGPNPYDLLGAALGACTTMTLRLYAARKGWPLTRVQTAVRHSRPSLEARDAFLLEIELEGPLDAVQRARLMEIAERCPVHLTLARGALVQARLLEDPAPGVMRPIEGPAHKDCMAEACAD